MPEPRGLKSKTIVIVLVATLIIATLASPAFAASGHLTAGGDDKTNAAGAAGTADPAKQGTKTTVADAGGVPATNAALVNELQQLKDTVQAQAERLVEHTQELESERAALHEELDRIAKLETELHVTPDVPKGNAEGGRVASFAAATPVATEPDAHTVHIQDADEQGRAQSQTQNKRQVSVIQMEHPLSFKIGTADFTPGGFADLTGVFRSTNTGTGLGTNFTSIPFNNTVPQSQLTEFRVTSQASRLSLKVDANISDSTSVTGYVESDFNGYQPPNANKAPTATHSACVWLMPT